MMKLLLKIMTSPLCGGDGETVDAYHAIKRTCIVQIYQSACRT